MSITPKSQTISDLFSVKQQYSLDFYQRDYQWKKVHIQKLLEDLFHRFNLEYKSTIDVNLTSISKFEWYYLNAYVTNEFDGEIFIVDGQQRLTSLTLILIKLYHLAKVMNLDEEDFVKSLILGHGITGATYWMGFNSRKAVLEDLFTHGKQTIDCKDNDMSIRNLYENYKLIDKVLEEFLYNP